MKLYSLLLVLATPAFAYDLNEPCKGEADLSCTTSGPAGFCSGGRKVYCSPDQKCKNDRVQMACNNNPCANKWDEYVDMKAEFDELLGDASPSEPICNGVSNYACATGKGKGSGFCLAGSYLACGEGTVCVDAGMSRLCKRSPCVGKKLGEFELPPPHLKAPSPNSETVIS